MTAAPCSLLLTPANRQTFDTCIALTLQMIAAVEFTPALSQDRPTREMLLCFAEQVDRNAQDIATMAGYGGTDVRATGQDVYNRLTASRDKPLEVAYHGVHSAAFLGLEQGVTTATMLASVACALRVLAERQGRLSN